MILAINFANRKYRRSQTLNTKMAYKYGADKVIEYSWKDVDKEYAEKYKEFLQYTRGAGYWIWKPWIIVDALKKVDYGDYVVYTDSGSAFVEPMQLLIDAMEKAGVDIMPFCINKVEKDWTKRDAFIVMDADYPEYTDTAQMCTTYMIYKKTPHCIEVCNKFLELIVDDRINTDLPSRLGVPDYEGFVENRHDQTVWSLLCKKEGIVPFRDPSQWGLNPSEFTDEVNERSTYPMVIESHRMPYIRFRFQMHYHEKKWYAIPRKIMRAWYKFLRIIGNQDGFI